MITETTLLKVLGRDGEPIHGGNGQWSLPEGDRPGEWMPRIANIAPCVRGYHLVTARQMLMGHWLGPRIFVAETRGERIDAGNKSVHAEVRLLREVRQWNDRTARLFAALCAEHVLPIYERVGTSSAPREAIQIARRFADGHAPREELAAAAANAAAYAAGDAAAYAAANTAAYAAANAADAAAANAAAYAAYAAADADAERDWQLARFLELFNAPGDW